MKTFPTGLDTLLATGTYVFADLYDFTLQDGTHLRYTTADTDVVYGGNTYTSKGPYFDQVASSSRGHWKAGLDLDTWRVTIAPAVADPITGATFPAQIYNQPWLVAARVGALDGATVDIHRAYWSAWPTLPLPINYDASMLLWLAAVGASTVSDTRKVLINNVILSLKSAAIFSKLDRLWLYANETSANGLVDIIGLATATAQGAPSPVFTVDRGFAGSATGWIDSGFNPTVGTPLFTLNSACAFGWAQQIVASAGAMMGQNVFGAPPLSRLFPWFTDNNSYFSLSSGQVNVASPQSTGLYAVSRVDGTNVSLYKGGALLSTQASATVSLTNVNFAILASNPSPSEFWGAGTRMAASGFGSGLTATDHTNLNTILQTYMTAVGA